jgi:hypothetical protein
MGEAAMKPKIDPSMAPLASIGIDIGKEIFHVVGLGADGKIAFRWKIKVPTSRCQTAKTIGRIHCQS